MLERDGKSTRLYRQGTNQSAQQKQIDELTLVGGAKPPPAPVVNTREVITDYLRPSLVYDGEILQGYVVYPGRRSGVFSQLGLQSGDIIVALNDAPLSDPTQAYESFRQLTTGVAMTATINRKGKAERLALDGARIVADMEREKNTAVAEPALLPHEMPSTRMVDDRF